MCKAPVGLGANRTLTFLSAIITRCVCANIFVQNYNIFSILPAFLALFMVKTNIKPPARAAPGAAGRQMGGGQEALAEVSVFFTGAAALCNCLCLSVLHGGRLGLRNGSFQKPERTVRQCRAGRLELPACPARTPPRLFVNKSLALRPAGNHRQLHPGCCGPPARLPLRPALRGPSVQKKIPHGIAVSFFFSNFANANQHQTHTGR